MEAPFDTSLGYLAGLATSALWTATSLLFTAAGKRIGPTAVNALRIGLAIAFLALTFHLRSEGWFPALRTEQLLLLAASGVTGLAIGDQALFTSFVDIGPRLAMLIMTTSPLFAAVFGWLLLGEQLTWLALLGIVLTISGVAWVILERAPRSAGMPAKTHEHRARGLLLAFIAAGCQAGGLLLSKQGMGHGWLPREAHLDPQAATYARMIFAGLGMLPILYWHHVRRRRAQASGRARQRSGRARTGILLAAGGAVVGPYLGVWMSLVAGDLVPIGIAQTLCSLSPVFILPFARLVYHEPITARAIWGAVLAVAGVAILFWPAG